MTDAERLERIAATWASSMLGGQTEDARFLLALARRAAQAEDSLRIVLTDRAADSDSLATRDAALIDATARMTAAECAAIAARWRPMNDAGRRIRDHFGLEGGLYGKTPLLSEYVRHETAAACATIAGTQNRAAEDAIRLRYGLPLRGATAYVDADFTPILSGFQEPGGQH